ncbi:MAG: pyridoxal 5'-phosphate synthase glutaminase subunit PdxT [Candidatus Thermoplasmatota archaeon]|jgi:5'-phosphate synthase pdxT subunit|nr:pyridoxal 5'-phosphate synthase glutaminase subunit PdxT [Candidatus Thermoplasmatota archaeon]
MVKKLSIGVIGVQGAISEHVSMMKNALLEKNISGNVLTITNKKELNNIDALIIPGGESSTISKILYNTGIYNVILKRIKKNNLPIMGTCAGCVILASEVTDDFNKIKHLSAVSMKVKRNAFGRQRESFEKNIDIKGFSKPFNAVFIRAPVIEKVWGNCEVLAKIDEKIVMVKEDKFLALSFHPELTDDLRIHKYFLDMI